MMECFYENSQRYLVVKYFCKKSSIFEVWLISICISDLPNYPTGDVYCRMKIFLKFEQNVYTISSIIWSNLVENSRKKIDEAAEG